MSAYAELAACSNFSFLRGASHGRDMVVRALALGQTGLGLCDRNTVAGVVRAYAALKDLREAGALAPQKAREGSGPGEHVFLDHPLPEDVDFETVAARAKAFKLCVGARLVFADGTPDLIVYPEARAGWGRLTRLLTLGNRRAQKGSCILSLADLTADCAELLVIVAPDRRLALVEETARRLVAAAPGNVWIAAAMLRRGDDRRRLALLADCAARTGAPLLGVNDALYADPRARDLQDVLTCIREGVSIDQAGRLLESNAERHLKAPAEMARLFKDARPPIVAP